MASTRASAAATLWMATSRLATNFIFDPAPNGTDMVVGARERVEHRRDPAIARRSPLRVHDEILRRGPASRCRSTGNRAAIVPRAAKRGAPASFTAIGSVLVSITIAAAARSRRVRRRLQQRLRRRQRADDDAGPRRRRRGSSPRPRPAGAAVIAAALREHVVADHAIAGPHQVRRHRRTHDAEADRRPRRGGSVANQHSKLPSLQ